MPEEIVFIVEPDPDGGYNARAVGYSIFSQAEELPDLVKNVQDAVRCHFDAGPEPRIIIK